MVWERNGSGSSQRAENDCWIWIDCDREWLMDMDWLWQMSWWIHLVFDSIPWQWSECLITQTDTSNVVIDWLIDWLIDWRIDLLMHWFEWCLDAFTWCLIRFDCVWLDRVVTQWGAENDWWIWIDRARVWLIDWLIDGFIWMMSWWIHVVFDSIRQCLIRQTDNTVEVQVIDWLIHPCKSMIDSLIDWWIDLLMHWFEWCLDVFT